MPNLACNSQQFLDLGMGSEEEHAILLCNYFNYIDRDMGRQRVNENDMNPRQNFTSYVVYGEAVPKGDTWYVARIDSVNDCLELWDAETGTCYAFDREEDGGVVSMN